MCNKLINSSKLSALTNFTADLAAGFSNLTALVEVVTDALAKGDKVSLKGFGNFEVRTRSERTGRNPRTGETMTIAASKAPAFKASSALKKAVNK